jgi:hypothetical protein
VFSKCKDNLENGRRLENMSWRLWYRECTLKETIQKSIPIPIQNTETNTIIEKPLTPASFTKIISSLNENRLVVPQRPILSMTEVPSPNPIITSKQPPPRNSKFFIKEGESDVDDESDWSSDDEYTDKEGGSIKEKTTQLVLDNTFKEGIMDESDDDYETINEEEGDYETVDEDAAEDDKRNKVDEMAFLHEFRKRSPCSTRPKGYSLLSNMLRAQAPPDYLAKSSNSYLPVLPEHWNA